MDAAHASAVLPPPQPEMFLRTASELARDAEADEWSFASAATSPSAGSSLSLSDSDEYLFSPPYALMERPIDESWDDLGMGQGSSFVQNFRQSELGGW